jgi:hypothetical protein
MHLEKVPDIFEDNAESGTPFGVLRTRDREPGVSLLDPRPPSAKPFGLGMANPDGINRSASGE